MSTIGKTLGNFEITSQLGKGGMGEVYRAKDQKLGREVAIKVLPEEFARDADRIARFQREAKLLASLNHPNIAAIYGLEESGGTNFLVLELVEGETLADQIARGPKPVEESLKLALQIAEALEAAHEKGIIHRDLKPANVKITPEGNIKVLDFGLAKALSDETQNVALSQSPTLTEAMTRAGVILGTAAYMSPEQARGGAVDKRADIWAFGVIMFEMLTGGACFEGETLTDVLAAVMRAEPGWAKLPSAVSSRLHELLRRCLAKDRRQRLHDIADARLELAQILSANSAVTAEVLKTKGVSKREIAAWVLAGLAIVAGVFAWILGTRNPAKKEEPVISYLLPPADSVACFRDGFAVSPDGRKIAFVSLSSKGERLIWVRDLGRPDSVPLAGTNDATYPFWSPDGKSIGFHSNGWLKRIGSEGGLAQNLCRAAMWGYVSSWGSSGTILFSFGTGLSRVSESGGEPAAVLSPGGVPPSFMADGERFVFPKTQDSKLLAFSASLGQPDKQNLIKGMTDAGKIEWAGADWFIFYRNSDRTLVAQRADLEKGEVIGPFKILAERVPCPNGPGAFSVSPAGVAAFLVNPPEAQNDYASRLTWVDRKGNVSGYIGEIRGYWYARISHDGRHIATTPDDDLWIYDAAKGMPVRLSREMDAGAQASWPVWSPQDDHLLGMVSVVAGDITPAIRDYSTSGGQAHDIIKLDGLLVATDWSRDGRYILLTRNQWTNGDLAYYDLNEKQIKPFLSGAAHEDCGVLSPDGHWIAYASNASRTFEVYVQPFPGGGQEKRVSVNGGMHPRWRGDGKELFFLTSDWSVMAAEVKLQPSLEISTPVRLFRMPMIDIIHGMVSPYDVSPDGQRFLVIVPVQSSPVPLTLVQNWRAFIER
jgi:eukaryotic-like serine/threonine-protein kinase